MSVTSGRIGFGDAILVEGINVVIHPAQRIGLVGANGTGKTTLLRILAGELKLDFGTVERKRGLRIGFLRQSFEGELQAVVIDTADIKANQARDIVDSTPVPTLSESRTLWQEMEDAMRELDALQVSINEIETLLSGPGLPFETKQTLLGKLGNLQHRFETLGGFKRENQIERVLSGVGFTENQYNQPIATMSGGQKQKAGLARLLLERPDLLLLDEPNNHLDLEGRRFLEDFLVSAPSAVLVVSHDRFFLNKVAQYVWEIDAEKIYTYRGNYDAFKVQRLDRIDRQRAEYATQQEYIKRTEEYIRRNIAGQNTRQARGRRKHLARVQRLDAVKERRTLKIDITDTARTSLFVAGVVELTHAFGDNAPLFQGLTFAVERGDKVGIIGPNGCGKTTLLSILSKKLRATAGKIEFGSNVQPAYLTQESTDLDGSLQVIDEFRRIAPSMDNPALRSILAAYLFCGDDAFKNVGDLSGGEKRRLALGKLLYTKPNLLLLDEPTNHFDLPSFEMLESALADFAGTVIMVSHDRSLLDAVATKIMAFTKDGVMMYEGNYSDYLDATRNEASHVKVSSLEERTGDTTGEPDAENKPGIPAYSNMHNLDACTPATGPDKTIPAYLSEPYSDNTVKPAKKRKSDDLMRKKQREKLESLLGDVEQMVSDAEDEYRTYVARMSRSEVTSDYEKLTALTAEMEACERRIAGLYEDMEKLMGEIEDLS